MKRITQILGVTALTFLLVACGTAAKKENGVVDKNTDKVAQKITVTSAGSLSTLDSTLYDDVYSSDTIGQIIEGLYRVDKNNEPELGIAAAEPKVSEDGLVYTFKLKDTKWSDGNPVIAEDFIYAFKNVVDPNAGSQNSNSMDIIKNGAAIASGKADLDTFGMKAIDDHTLEITLETPVAYFKKLLTGTRFLPKDSKFAKEAGKKYGTSSEQISGNGPFLINGWDGTNDTWTFKKNPDYWDVKNVKLDQIDVTVIKEIVTGVNLFDAGDVQFTTLADEYAKQKQGDPLYHQVPKALIGYVNFNNKRELTGNVHARKAISQAFDKESFTKNILADGSTPLNGLVADNFAKDPSGGKEFREENGDLVKYDLEAAKKEWALAKTDLGKDSFSIELLSADSAIAKKTVEFLQGELEKNLEGLKVTIKSVPIAQRLDLNRSGDFDFFFGTWTPDYADPVDFLQSYTTTGGLNFGKYSNPAFDQGIAEVTGNLAAEPEKRWQKLLETEKIGIQQDAMVAPVYQGSIAYLEADNVKDIQLLPFGRSVSYRLAYVK